MALIWSLLLYLWVSCYADKAAFDCPMRQLALQYAAYIQPWLTTTQLQQIADSLNGAQEAQNCNVTPNNLEHFNEKNQFRTAAIWDDLNDSDDTTIYVDYINGNDKNNGTKLYPLKLLETAIIRARKIYGPNVNKKIILRKGKHYLPNTIYLNSADNNTIITNYNNEFADLSGSIPIKCEWKLYKQNIYSCTINDANITEITGLRVNGQRGVRARYPNANPERDGFGSQIKPLNWFPSTLPKKPDVLVYSHNYPVRNDTDGKDNVYEEPYFWYYNLGIGGMCRDFVPNAAYWCSAQGQGGYVGVPYYQITTGLSYNSKILPNAPYKDTTNGIIQTWQCAHWATWMFTFGEYDSEKQTIKFGRGGFQGGRGCGAGSNFYVDNIFEELDEPNEFYFHSKNRTLYYFLNKSEHENINDIQFEATKLKVLLNYSSTNNITLRGITIRDSAKTFMDDHGIPSGGDWALQRTGAIYIENSENIMISSNLLTRLDGIAISINKYARNVTVYKNEIEWTGASAITSWGDTFMPNNTYGVPAGMGYDGTKGTQPRYLNISYNYVHELGLWEKQSSLYFQAKSCLNYIAYNIFYNGPRAGINFNDGFGGGSRIHKNLLFNTCRESGDHGPFNSWDRQVYVTSVRNGSPSVIKQFDYISQNFIIANYHSSMAIDNDDGSCYYHTHNNFLVYSPCGLKNNFGGHDNYHYNNIYGYISAGSACFQCDQDGDSMQLAGHNDHYYNNTCVINVDNPGSYGQWPCEVAQDRWPILGNNSVHIMGNNTKNTGLCGHNEAEFQSKYKMDIGTQILGPVDDQSLLQQAHDLLWE